MKRSLRILPIIVAVVLCAQNVRAETIERIVAVAGDDVITMRDMRDEGAVVMAMQNDDIHRLDNMEPDVRKSKLTELARGLVQRRLIEKEAIRLGSPVGEREVQQQLEAIYSQNGGTEAEFKEYLQGFGLKLETFRAVIRGELQSQFVMRSQLAGQVVVADADILACARETAPLAEHGTAMDLRQILIREDAGDSALGLDTEIASTLNPVWWNSVDKVTELLASGVRDQIAADPAWFLDAVKIFSSGQSVEQGGRLGTFSPTDLSKDFDQVFSLPKGGVSQVIRTAAGYHIVYVDDIKEGATEAWTKAQDNCRNKLMIQEGERLTQSWLNTMMEKNYVSIKVSEDISKTVD